ncbi:MAG: hypothetical protein HY048_03620 [Acidobacteria bacterium]|nr:hypothetical protein [Acidobacteriota bacterium]
MNYGRLVLAAVAGTVVDACYGFVVYGLLLTSEFARTPGVYRAMDTQMAYMPFLFGGVFLAMLAAAFIYAKGYEGGAGLMEGARCGAALGVFAAGYAALIGYATTNIGRKMAGELMVANLVEWTINGIVIGLVYKPASKH